MPQIDLESPRSKLVQKLAEDLDGPSWGVSFQTILTCTKTEGVGFRGQAVWSGHETESVVGSGQYSANENSCQRLANILGSISACFE